MKPQLLKVSTNPLHSFYVRRDLQPTNNRWHYHPEVELIHIRKGSGTQFIGDNIRAFDPGDVILVGAQLPHFWRFENEINGNNSLPDADVTVAHFTLDFWGAKFLLLPENRVIREVLEKAKRGILVTGQNKAKVARILDRMLHAEGYTRIMLLLEAIGSIASCESLELLSSMGFASEPAGAEDERINVIYDYSLKNYTSKIRIDRVAKEAKMSVHSFCRYFKSRTGKTYSRFLIELRVGKACKLLIENKISVKQICYECGFSNFTCFHKYFKQVTGKSPVAYQKDFINT